MTDATLGPGWERAAALDDVPEGEVAGVHVGGQPVALYKVEGELYATHDICSHEHAHLSEGYLDGCEIECPLHQARFDIRTGQAMCKPATGPVAVYPVRIVGQDIFINLTPAA